MRDVLAGGVDGLRDTVNIQINKTDPSIYLFVLFDQVKIKNILELPPKIV